MDASEEPLLQTFQTFQNSVNARLDCQDAKINQMSLILHQQAQEEKIAFLSDLLLPHFVNNLFLSNPDLADLLRIQSKHLGTTIDKQLATAVVQTLRKRQTDGTLTQVTQQPKIQEDIEEPEDEVDEFRVRQRLSSMNFVAYDSGKSKSGFFIRAFHDETEAVLFASTLSVSLRNITEEIPVFVDGIVTKIDEKDTVLIKASKISIKRRRA